VGLGRLALERLVRVAAVFPGQGSQSVGMGGALVENFAPAARLYERAERILGYDLLRVIRDGPEERLRETCFSQPAIFVTNYALALAAGDGLGVVVSAGHSFAEYCSLTLSGALEFDEALLLVRERGLAMQEAAEGRPGAMAAILGLDAAAVRTAMARAQEMGRVQIANFNAPGQIVVSGDRDAVLRAGELAVAAGAKRAVKLNVSGAWHSDLMEAASVRFAPFVRRAQIELPRFTVVSNVDARPYTSVAGIRENLIRSVTQEVLWHDTAERVVAEGVELIVEFGGSAVLAPMVKRLRTAPRAIHVGDERGLAKLAALVPLRAPA
jgi:[acyl-carrier-protein] S-malonyltransferase